MRALPIAVTLALGACQFNAVERDIEHREVGLYVPSAIRADEQLADRVTILHPSGRTTVMEQAVLRRDGERLRLESTDPEVSPIELALADIQAVEIERWTRGEAARLASRDPKARVETDFTVANIIGGVLIGAGVITTFFLVVDAMGGD